MASSRCRAASAIRIAKGKSKPASATRRRRRSKGLRFETIEAAQAYSRSLGDALGRHPHPRHDEAPGRRDVCRGAAGARPASRSNRFAITGTANAPCISMAASKSRPRTTAHRLAGSGSASRCSGTICTSACSHRRPGSCCASICARPAAGIASTTTIGRRARRRSTVALLARGDDGRRPHQRRLTITSISTRAPPASAACSACSPSPRSTARPSSRTPRKAALELGVPTYRFLRRYLERRSPVPLTLRQVDPLIRQLTLYRDLIDRKTGDPRMNLVELDHALRKLRLSGMAAVLETRLRHAADRETDAARPRVDARRRRAPASAGPAAGAPAQTGGLSRSRPLHSTPLILISTRR